MATGMQSNPIYYSLSSLSTGQKSSSRTVVLHRRPDHTGFGVYLGEDVPSGLYVVTVERNSPAADANIQPGDRVIAVNGQLVSSMATNPKEMVVKAATNTETLTFTIESTNALQKIPKSLTNSYTEVNNTNHHRSKQQHSSKHTVNPSTDLESYLKSLFANENIHILPSSSNQHNEFVLTSNPHRTSSTDFNTYPARQSYTDRNKEASHQHHHRRRHRPKQPLLVTKETQTSPNEDEDGNMQSQQQQTSPIRPYSSHPSMGVSQRILNTQISNSTNESLESKALPTNKTSQFTALPPSPTTEDATYLSTQNPQSTTQHMIDIVDAAVAAERNRDQLDARQQPPSREVTTREQPSARDVNARNQPTAREANTRDQPTSREVTTREQPPSREANARNQPTAREANTRDQPTSREVTTREQPPSRDVNVRNQPTAREANTRDQPTSREVTAQEQPPSREANARNQPTAREANTRDQPTSREVTTREQPPSHEVNARNPAPAHEVPTDTNQATAQSQDQNPPPPYSTEPTKNQETANQGAHNVSGAQDERQPPSQADNVALPSRGEGLHEIRMHRSADFEGFGFHLQYNKSYFLVHRVEDGSPAEQAGLRANDVILKVNQQTTEKMSHNVFVQIVSASSDVVFVVQHIDEYLRANPAPPRNPHIASAVTAAITEEGDKRKTGISKALSKLSSR